MPNALTNTNISATYKGVLHTNGTIIPPNGQEAVYDGTGVQSALSVGRTNEGASVTGNLSATALYAGQLRMPNTDGVDKENHVVARTSTGILELRSIASLIGSSPSIPNGTYDNPRITVEGGVITNIVSRPTITLLGTPAILINTGRQLINNYLGTTNQVKTIINNSNINWSTYTGYVSGTTARYAIINTKLFLQSNAGDFVVFLKMDGKTISTGEVREDYQTLGVDTIYDSCQQFFEIPASGTSSYYFEVQTLNGSTNKDLNLYQLNVTLDGWVY